MTALLRRSFRGAVTASRWIVAAPLLLLWLLAYLGIASFAAIVVGYVTVLAMDAGAGVDIAGTAWEVVLAVPLFGVAWLVAGSVWAERTGVGLWFRRRPRASHGSARFATRDARDARNARGGIDNHAGGLLIGRDVETGQAIAYHGPAHLLTLAPTRSGKGVGTVIPNLLLPLRSVLVVDPKGENARITGKARSEIGPMHVLDPFGLQEPPERPEGAVLFLLDEFAALGRLEAVERAMGLMAGYGLQLWPILQDLSQLRALYGPRANTWL